MDLYKLLNITKYLQEEIEMLKSEQFELTGKFMEEKDLKLQTESFDDFMARQRAKPKPLHYGRAEDNEYIKPISITTEINNIARSLGLKAHIKGYKYIQDAILMITEDGTMINKITKKLYPTIARTYGTTPSRVERAIRHSIETLWQTGDFSIINKLFGREVNICEKKATNSEFLATLADYIVIRQEKNGR